MLFRSVAGGDISDTPLASTGSIAPESGIYTLIPSLQLGGPGTFDVEAGRNLGPLASQLEVVNQGFGGSHITGIDTVGNLYNPYLAHQSASIDVLFGVGPGIDLADFIAGYIDPAASTVGVPSYSSELVTFMEQYEAGLNYAYGDGLLQDQQQAAVTLSPQQAWTDFQGLNPKVPMPSYVQQLFVEQVFNNVLFLTGQDYNDTASAYYHQYARGYAAINTLFPPAYGYTQNALHGGDNGSNQPVITGNLDVRGSTIQTQQGGGINIFGPGGQALIASASAPPYVSAGGQVLAGPNTEGILTLEQGDINIYTDDSVLLAQSRVFTEQGGNILIWSSNGDINAGNGTKATAYVPPLQYSCDQYEYCIVEPAGEVTGAGIATLQTIADAPPGDVELVTPRGTVDAGNAGIRVSGNLTIAALHVANVYNIQVQGKTVGLPSTHVDTGALTTASSAVAAAEAAAELAAQAAPGEVLVQVEVVGFGVPDEEQKRRIRREHHRNTR